MPDKDYYPVVAWMHGVVSQCGEEPLNTGLDLGRQCPYVCPGFIVRVWTMPIYEYQCNDCGHQLEALQKVSEDPLKDCPACGKPGLRRLVSAAGFRLKGSGWYETDFKGKSEKKANLAIGDSAAAKPASSSGGDKKPAAK